MKIEIIDSKIFIQAVDEIVQRENSFIVVLNNGDTIVFRKPFQKNMGNKYGFKIVDSKIESINVDSIKKKTIESRPKKNEKEKKKRNFSEKQLEHQQKFAKKMKDFWNENRSNSE